MINIPFGFPESEKSLYLAAYEKCLELKRLKTDIPIQKIVEDIVKHFDSVIQESSKLRDFLFEEISVETEPIIKILGDEVKKSDWWKQLKNSPLFQSEYWTRYKNYLQKKDNWSINTIRDIDDSTDDVMNAISNATNFCEEKRMGLVFGYVQSGKTAHYIGLINKAIDSGYKIIIVLSGIHNNLRSQTQSRIDEEVLGYETSLEAQGKFVGKKNAIGVGVGKNNQIENSQLFQSLTTRDEKGDFNIKISAASMYPPFIIVTKKNASVLRRLIKYFQKSPFSETDINGKKYVPSEFPALIIDDEADQASVNTNECYDEKNDLLDTYNPTTINGLIRSLLNLFKCSSYVGYTATPFANIFIPPHITDLRYGNDLYPKDFIMKMPCSNYYIGAREFFGINREEASEMPLCRNIISGKSYLGKGTKSTDSVGEIPDELKKAIKSFVISTAIRNLRGQKNKPNTMLIHIIRFIAQQDKIKKRVDDYKNELGNYIVYGDIEIEDELKTLWKEDFCVTTENMVSDFPKYMANIPYISWHELFNEIKRLFTEKEFLVYSINGKSIDSLMYKERIGKPFNVIVIGGDKLSRGLTLEGLTISYFTRSSNTYDTLMQMGRWFGYKNGYLDLCRLYITPVLKQYFFHISEATEELVRQFDFMNDMEQTPMSFGLRVATHPELLISGSKKIRTGKTIETDFSNKLSQTRTFDINPEQHDRNFDSVEMLLQAIGEPIDRKIYWKSKNREQIGEHYFWTDVDCYYIKEFLENYETSVNAARVNSRYMADYISNQNKCGGLILWTVCLINVGKGENFSINGLIVNSGIERSDKTVIESKKICSIKTMTSKEHEYLDYTQEQLDKVSKLKKLNKKQNNLTLTEYIRKETRPRNKGFLILYPIGKAGSLTANKKKHKTPFGFAIVFPHRQGYGELQSYRITDIAIERDNYELYE